MKKLLLALLLPISVQAAPLSAEVHAQAHQAVGLKGQMVYLSCLHSAAVTNTTGMPQEILVSYSICAENHGCKERHYKVKVGIGTWRDSIPMAMYPTYHVTGNFRLTCTTSVNGLAHIEDSNIIMVR